MGWVVNATRSLYPREIPGIKCIGVWVDPRAILDGCGNLVPTGIRSPDRPVRSEWLYRLNYPGPPQEWSLPQNVYKDSGCLRPAFFAMGKWNFFLWGCSSHRCKANHSPLATAEIKNMGSYTATLPGGFMVWIRTTLSLPCTALWHFLIITVHCHQHQ